jgi:hypothetical protein
LLLRPAEPAAAARERGTTEVLMTDKTRYLTVFYQQGEPAWFTLVNPPDGFPHTTSRLKIGHHHYFLNPEAPMVDLVSGTKVIFIHVVTHHSFGGHAFNPEGNVYELTRVDPNDFQIDTNWRKIDNPFVGLD